jgi:hypothetical protein
MRFVCVFAIFLLLLTGVVCGAAQGSSAAPAAGASSAPADSSAEPEPQRRPRFPQEEDDPIRKEMEKKRQKALTKERFTELKRDTDKLLELATELKTHVDKADENMLSLDVLKKAEQIEKLAKNVREKMKGY